MPPKVLNVAEKPSVAKEISRILNGGHIPRGRDGGNTYCKIYDFPCQIRCVLRVVHLPACLGATRLSPHPSSHPLTLTDPTRQRG